MNVSRDLQQGKMRKILIIVHWSWQKKAFGLAKQVSEIAFSYNRPFDKRWKQNVWIVGYGPSKDVAVKFQMSFVHDKHNTESCEIKICLS